MREGRVKEGMVHIPLQARDYSVDIAIGDCSLPEQGNIIGLSSTFCACVPGDRAGTSAFLRCPHGDTSAAGGMGTVVPTGSVRKGGFGPA